ncbi:hypothetical protein HII12_004425 [Brettanomyces bruxellensis]|uniref:Uncharacterized protein n=1 Tax=Dekkera bruxellensis TaxID=5007 RepID=A0A8H6B9B4_DEKBR|nr:hypothetical protein HII12_004425 [Brettanomyces bruxellensis]
MPYFNWRKSSAGSQKGSSAPPESTSNGQPSASVIISSSKSGNSADASPEEISHSHSPTRMFSMFHFSRHKSSGSAAGSKAGMRSDQREEIDAEPEEIGAEREEVGAEPGEISAEPGEISAKHEERGSPLDTSDCIDGSAESGSVDSEKEEDSALGDPLAVPPAASRAERTERTEHTRCSQRDAHDVHDTQRHSSRKHKWKYHKKLQEAKGEYFDFQPVQRDAWWQHDGAAPANRRLSNSWSPNKPVAARARAGCAPLRRSSAFEPAHSSLISIPAPSRRSQCGVPTPGALPRSASCRGFQPASQRRSSSLRIQAPHLITEDFTSPVLDSTVELITNQNLNDVDVVQLGFRSPSSAFMRSVGRRRSTQSSAGTAGAADITGTSVSPTSAQLAPVPVQAAQQAAPVGSAGSNMSGESFSGAMDSGRKSISFYSYSDLVNFEKSSKLSRDLVMSPATAASSSVSTGGVSELSAGGSTGAGGSAGAGASILVRPGRSPDGKIRAVGMAGAVSSSLGAISPPSTTDDNCDLFSLSSEPEDNVNSMSSNGNEATDIISDWVPCGKRTRDQAAVGTPLETCFSRGANLEGGGLDAVLCGEGEESGSTEESNLERNEAVNVCSAKDLLQQRSRELHNSFGGN